MNTRNDTVGVCGVRTVFLVGLVDSIVDLSAIRDPPEPGIGQLTRHWARIRSDTLKVGEKPNEDKYDNGASPCKNRKSKNGEYVDCVCGGCHDCWSCDDDVFGRESPSTSSFYTWRCRLVFYTLCDVSILFAKMLDEVASGGITPRTKLDPKN